MATLKVPGIYSTEKNAFPNAVVAVATAVPVFIGYTEKADNKGKSLTKIPFRITSLREYELYFGKGIKPKFFLTDADGKSGATFLVDGKSMQLQLDPKRRALLYNSMRLFFSNGGGTCYILSVRTYGNDPAGIEINESDFSGVFENLAKEQEPTLVVMPDAILLDATVTYSKIYRRVLEHCAAMGTCMGIFDLRNNDNVKLTNEVVHEFRKLAGSPHGNYGVAYYPWLNTSIVQTDEIGIENLDASIVLKNLLTEEKTKEIISKYTSGPTINLKDINQALLAASPTFKKLISAMQYILNQLPASAAIAGMYTLVDNSRGVWKAPANVSLSAVNSPLVEINNDEQEELNVDAGSGLSINAIRSFPGQGVLVWGARTLDGNSQDWRYINVRRTMIMIEQSVKSAVRAYIFEANVANTWVTVKSMLTNFLTSLWKSGALQGATPEESFDVQVGLGVTMTPQDILDGMMNVVIKVAVTRPGELILITFSQQQQKS